jgi:hypothetical protein
MITWELYEDGKLIETFPSHRLAKSVKYHKIAESKEQDLHLHYEIKKVVEEKPKEIPQWKRYGFKSQRALDEYLEEIYEDIRKGVI